MENIFQLLIFKTNCNADKNVIDTINKKNVSQIFIHFNLLITRMITHSVKKIEKTFLIIQRNKTKFKKKKINQIKFKPHVLKYY